MITCADSDQRAWLTPFTWSWIFSDTKYVQPDADFRVQGLSISYWRIIAWFRALKFSTCTWCKSWPWCAVRSFLPFIGWWSGLLRLICLPVSLSLQHRRGPAERWNGITSQDRPPNAVRREHIIGSLNVLRILWVPYSYLSAWLNSSYAVLVTWTICRMFISHVLIFHSWLSGGLTLRVKNGTETVQISRLDNHLAKFREWYKTHHFLVFNLESSRVLKPVTKPGIEK